MIDFKTPTEAAKEYGIFYNKHLQDALEKKSREAQDRHYWYIELVARSKAAELIDREPAESDFREHGRIIIEHGNEPEVYRWHWLMWDDTPLVGWRMPFNRINFYPEDGKHTFTYVEYKR